MFPFCYKLFDMEVLCVQVNMNQVGQLIKESRNNLKLTQEQFAERVGISLRYVTKIENEGKFPSVEVLARIIDALSISPNDIFYPDPHSDNKVEYASKLLAKCNGREINAVISMLESFASNL
jgi:transcriptional regulator with XRE-family HTH domain